MSNIKEKSKKSIFNAIFSRFIVAAVLIALQAFYIVYVVRKDYLIIDQTGQFILSIVMALYFLNSKKNPSVKSSWIIIIFILPIFGTLFYWFTELNPLTVMVGRRIKRRIKETSKFVRQEKAVLETIEDNSVKNLANYVWFKENYPIYKNTNIKYYPLGEDMFEDMLVELKNAKKYIFMEYFIIDEGYMWGSILEILKEKVKEGVEVRVMYDGMCSFDLLPYNYADTLASYGIKAKVFSQIKPFLSSHYNNRDHRKITIIDGKVGFTGGINLADEYINKIERFGHWKDTGIKIEGDALNPLTLMFLQMWSICGKNLPIEDFSKYLNVSHDISNEAYAIVYGDSPFDEELLAENIYIDLINQAKDYIYIATPYLVTDNEVTTAMIIAAKKGIDIRLILPHIPDKETTFALAHSRYKQLFEAGVKIYEYEPGYVHAKMVVSDDNKAVVGTINFDYRSLYHNFECATFMYNQECIKDIKKDFIETMDKSILMDVDKLSEDSLKRKIYSIGLKLFEPLI